MNQIAGYKKGDKVKVRTNVIYAGTPQTGEAFETWKPGVIIAEGFTNMNMFGELDQQRIIVKVGNRTHIRPAAMLR